jgi:hypothetical protein
LERLKTAPVLATTHGVAGASDVIGSQFVLEGEIKKNFLLKYTEERARAI